MDAAAPRCFESRLDVPCDYILEIGLSDPKKKWLDVIGGKANIILRNL
jgi:hypothetical protein